ncbi:ABC transporter permease [Pseudochelatococcus lubricantis]|uniref:ABC transporter permease n=1 Tax=Pseudochelatococcus lubricantis TaxID=1538102 RepID=UPI0035EBC19F
MSNSHGAAMTGCAPAGAGGGVVGRRGGYRLVSPKAARAARPSAAADIAMRALVPAAAVAFWWLASRQGWIRPQLLPPPGDVLTAFLTLMQNGMLWDNLSVSLARAGVGFLIGIAIALPLGILAGLYRLGDQLIDPTLQMIRTIPFLAVAPLFVVWLGIGEPHKIALVALACAVPFYLNTQGGVRQADPAILEAAQVFGASRAEVVWRIILPNALPQMLIGLRQSIGLALLALVLAEQTNAPKGIGALALAAQQYFETDILLVCIIVYAVWGLVGDGIVRFLEAVAMPWRRKRREA